MKSWLAQGDHAYAMYVYELGVFQNNVKQISVVFFEHLFKYIFKSVNGRVSWTNILGFWKYSFKKFLSIVNKIIYHTLLQAHFAHAR